MTERDPQLLLELLEDERTSARRRETFLVSVILHLLIVLLLITQPDLFRRVLQNGTPVSAIHPRDVTLLYQPPELPKVKVAPKTPVLSDANRKAQPGTETPPPPLRYQPPAPPPAPRPNSPRLGEENGNARQLPPIGLPNFPEAPKDVPKQRPTLEQIPRPESTPSQAQLTLPPIVSPNRGTDAILRGMAKEHASGGGQSLGGGYQDYGPQDPNLNIPGPQILSDTMGVDFNPYLLRVLSLVRRNWYAVIPEIARLGKQGRVVLEFSILRNGNVPNLILAATSGTDSLDGAALSSIRLSSPFPPLPPEFPGQDIRLRFIYLYNTRVDY
jgi:TonB family protein